MRVEAEDAVEEESTHDYDICDGFLVSQQFTRRRLESCNAPSSNITTARLLFKSTGNFTEHLFITIAPASPQSYEHTIPGRSSSPPTSATIWSRWACGPTPSFPLESSSAASPSSRGSSSMSAPDYRAHSASYTNLQRTPDRRLRQNP